MGLCGSRMADVVRVFWFDTVREARKVENILIRQLKPPYNTARPARRAA